MSLRHRSALSAKFSALKNHATAKLKRRKSIAGAVNYAVESLESRIVLTALNGMDPTHNQLVFFGVESTNQPFTPVYETIKLFGNIQAEIIGRDAVTGQLENLPGQLNGMDVNGGFALNPGATAIGQIPLNLESIAVDPQTGVMYGVTLTIGSISVTVPGSPPTTMNVAYNFINLVTIDPTSGAVTSLGPGGSIDMQLLAAAGIQTGSTNTQLVSSVPAITFVGGTMYLAYDVGAGATGGGGAANGGVPHLASLDPNNPQTSVIGYRGTFSGMQVNGLADINGTLTGASKSNVFPINLGNTDNDQVGVAPAVNGPISGLAQTADGNIYVSTDNQGPTSELYQINPGGGTDAIDDGPLPQTAVVKNGLTLANGVGANPAALTYDPTTNTLFSFDTAAHTLFSISQINRTRSLSIFQIYVSQSDSTGEIFTSESNTPLTEGGANGFMIPYGAGLAGGLSVVSAQPPHAKIIVAAPAGSGTALIGSRTVHLIPNAINDLYTPVITGTVTADPVTGLDPFTTAPYGLDDMVTAGIVSAPATSIGTIAVSGPIMGEVNLAGNIDTFYAGWLLTGLTTGEPALNLVTDGGNFTVLGDIRSLIVTDSIGTDSDAALTKPTYVTGFDMHVGGTIGLVQSFDSIIGNINDVQSPTAPNLSTNQQENEIRTAGIPNPWGAGLLGGNTAFNNDTFATAQDVGALPTTVGGAPSGVVIDGTLQAEPTQGDYADYYGVALLAGQTITVQVVPFLPAPIDVAIFNPDGDLVASDYNQVDLSQTQQQQFRFTTDRPGIYRFAVSPEDNPTFTDAGNRDIIGDTQYQLMIQNTGDIAIGAVVATNNIFDNVDFLKPEASFGTMVGDVGAIIAGNDFFSNNGADTVDVADGNIRELSGSSIGLDVSGIFDPEIQVPNGNVGLIQATSPTGVLFFNYPDPGAIPVVLPPAIGGNYQLISAAFNFDAKVIADGSIGVIRAGEMIGVAGGFIIGPQYFSVNFDNSPVTVGSIDLIDVTGQFGDNNSGGPHITTGPEGNVGYIRVGGLVYGDFTFGGGQPAETYYQPGESATITDDSGAQVVITPTGTPSVPPTVGTSNDTTGTTVDLTLPQISVIAYGIEGSGGSAIINITSTGGVSIATSGQESGQTVQIGEIDALGLGQGTVESLAKATTAQPLAPVPTTGQTTSTTTTAPTFYTAPDTAGPVGRTLALLPPPVLNPNSTTPLNVIISGSAQSGVFEVFGGYFSSIVNSTTGGEIVNTIAANIGAIVSAGTVGLAKNHTGAALNGAQVVANTFPLIDDHNAITEELPIPSRSFTQLDPTNLSHMETNPFTPALGPVITSATTTTVTTATGTVTTTVTTPVAVGLTELGIGAITAAQGIGNINCLGTVPLSIILQMRGNIGPISGSILGPVYATGTINSVALGAQGIASSGTGANSQAGVYALAQIGPVTSNSPADIRGTVASEVGLTGILLKGGSLIGATIENVGILSSAVQLPGPKFITPNLSPITNPPYDVGNIIIDGNGGIIGTLIGGNHIGHVDVHRGFGIFDSAFTTLGDGTLAGLLADGYGIRDTSFTNGASIGSIIATGNGSNVSSQLYSPDVRLSEVDQFDPFSGFAPNFLTDIDVVTTATAAEPKVQGFDGGGTDTGVILDCSFVGSRDLGSVRAYQIRASDPLVPDIFDFANSIGSITTTSNEDGISVLTGRFGTFRPGGNIDHLTFQIAGPIKNLAIAGNVTSDSLIAATGRNGNIGTLKVGGTLQGSITAARKINNATIGGDLTGTVSAKQVGTLKVGGFLNGGNLDINGSVGNLVFNGNLGLPSETLTIHGSVNSIKILGNLNADISIEGNLGSLYVGQSVITDTLTDIVGKLNKLTIKGDFQAGATIQATIVKHQKISGLNQGTLIG